MGTQYLLGIEKCTGTIVPLLEYSDRYSFLAFTFKGRIKSLIRFEEKINGKIVGFIYDYRHSPTWYNDRDYEGRRNMD